MDKEEALDLLRRGQSKIWNDYRKKHPNWKPDLEGADLSEIDFAPRGKPDFDLTNANLVGCKLPSLNRLLPRAMRGNLSLIGKYPALDGEGASVSFQTTRTTARGLVKEEYNGPLAILSGALINQTTSIKDTKDLEILVKLGARFVTQDELKRERAEVKRKLFISYAWAEEAVVDAIEQWLRLKGLITIMDKRNFIAGEPISEEIVRGMREADAILLFHSERTVGKRWIDFERRLAREFEQTATQEKREPPQLIFVVLDNTPLPKTEKDRIAIMAKGKKLPQVCQEIYDAVLRLPKTSSDIDLSKWEDYEF